jgi:hypothetical protein
MPSNHRNHPATRDDPRRAALVAELAKLNMEEERSLANELFVAEVPWPTISFGPIK